MQTRGRQATILALAAMVVVAAGALGVYRFGEARAASAAGPPSLAEGTALGKRVLFFTSESSESNGATVFLDSKYVGAITRDGPGDEAYSLMLPDIAPGTYRVTIRQNGYPGFNMEVRVPASDRPPEQTSKVLVRFDLPPRAKG